MIVKLSLLIISTKFLFSSLEKFSRHLFLHILLPPPPKEHKSNKLNKRKKKATTTSSINFTDIHSVYFSLDRPKVLRNDKTSQRISTLHNQPVNYSRSKLLNLRTKFSILDDLFLLSERQSDIANTRNTCRIISTI